MEDIYEILLKDVVETLKQEKNKEETKSTVAEVEENGNALMVEGQFSEENIPTFEEGNVPAEDIPIFEENKEETKKEVPFSFKCLLQSEAENTNDADKMESSSKFSIRDDSTAEWALKKIAEAQAERDRICQLADEEIAKLNEKKLREERRFEKETQNLKNCLAEYFQTVKRKKTTTRETYQLLSGKLILNKGKKEFVKNDSKLLSYLNSQGNSSFIKKSVKWGEFKKQLAVKEDGTVVDSQNGKKLNGIVKCIIHPDTFDVEIDTKK